MAPDTKNNLAKVWVIIWPVFIAIMAAVAIFFNTTEGGAVDRAAIKGKVDSNTSAITRNCTDISLCRDEAKENRLEIRSELKGIREDVKALLRRSAP